MEQPTIEDAEVLAARYGAEGVLILAIAGGRYGVASWAQNKAKCRQMAGVVEDMHDRILSGQIDLGKEFVT